MNSEPDTPDPDATSKPPKTRHFISSKSDKETFHVSLGGAIRVEFRRQMDELNLTANALLNKLVKEGIHNLRKKQRTKTDDNN